MKNAYPNDINQGQVGDCWLVSAISALAEFPGAIEKVFAKTKNIRSLPSDAPSKYTITLYRVHHETGKCETVDYVVDERLPIDEGGNLKFAAASQSNELWVCYLEKALAAHCGGYDGIVGDAGALLRERSIAAPGGYKPGDITPDPFAMLTGIHKQYYFTCVPSLGGGRNKKAPWITRTTWPENVDGENSTWDRYADSLSEDEMFDKMCAWNDANYVMTCHAPENLKKQGIVDFHAYSLLRCVRNVAGTTHDMVEVRNPHGRTELAVGQWNDNGPRWKKHLEVKAFLKPEGKEDGLFWMSKKEFFSIFTTFTLCAEDMKAWSLRKYDKAGEDKNLAAYFAAKEAAIADEIKKRFSGEDMTSPDGKWVLDCFSSTGAKYEGPPKKLVKGGLGTIQKCIEEFKANPKKYEAICFWEKAFTENYDPQECNMFPRAPGKTFQHVRDTAKPNQRWRVYEWTEK